jgi:hypothetical protein
MNEILREARTLRDILTGFIVGGLVRRVRYQVNRGVFTEKFPDGQNLTWYELRLKKDQGVDSYFGRYLFEDQIPVGFTKEQLDKPGATRNPPKLGLLNMTPRVYPKVLQLYKDFIPKICRPGENPGDYGATVKIDVDNILTLCERTETVGREVAAGKIRDDETLLHLATKREIELALTIPSIERDVLVSALDNAKRDRLPNVRYVIPFFKELIRLTREVEVDYIQSFQRSMH